MRQKILEILGSVIKEDGLEAYPEDAKLSDLGLTSILFIQFIVKLEEAFSIEVLDSDLSMRKFETVGAMFQTLEKYFSSGERPLKKVLVCDCDNVLWQGIAGEEKLLLTEREIRFQNTLCALYGRGVLLCLCSKNEEQNVLDSFSLSGMVLTMDHIVSYRVNRADKAANLRDLAEELNLSADSFVFVDDSDYELGLVQALLPEVTVVKADPGQNWIDTVPALFPLPASSEERNRTELYREQKNRERERIRFSSVEEYNASLQTVTLCETLSKSNFGRFAELSQRTNQCNLALSRYAESDLAELSADDSVSLISLSASDKYGDMGIVGGAVLRNGENSVIEGFFLSCRVFGRGFEEILLSYLCREAKNRPLTGILKRTDRNRNYHDFYQKNGVIVRENSSGSDS